MRFWNLERLRSELIAGDLPPREGLQYLIATAVLTIVAYALPMPEWNQWDSIQVGSDIILVVLGTLWIYRANGGPEGRDFLGRFLALYWLVGLRMLVLVLVPTVAVMLFLETKYLGRFPEETTPVEVVVYSFWNAVFYWRVVVSVRELLPENAA